MDIGLRILAGLTNSQMHIFSRCGYWIQWKQADTIHKLVFDFLDR
jgi:2-hydroxy-6-oxonona-2,4-dienedioate hydrolase